MINDTLYKRLDDLEEQRYASQYFYFFPREKKESIHLLEHTRHLQTTEYEYLLFKKDDTSVH